MGLSAAVEVGVGGEVALEVGGGGSEGEVIGVADSGAGSVVGAPTGARLVEAAAGLQAAARVKIKQASGRLNWRANLMVGTSPHA